MESSVYYIDWFLRIVLDVEGNVAEPTVDWTVAIFVAGNDHDIFKI